MSERTVLAPPPPGQVRAELEEFVRADLLGPAGGETEEVTEQVTERYIVGTLAPRGEVIPADEMDRLAEDTEEGIAAADDDEEDGDGAPSQATFFPSSFGLSFVVDGEETDVVVEGSWGRYHRRDSEVARTDGTFPKVWKREPMSGVVSLPLVEGPVAETSFAVDQPEVVLRGRVRRRDGQWVVSLFLVNAQHAVEKLKATRWIFQCELRVRGAGDASAPFRRRGVLVPGADHGDAAELRALAMRYRSLPEFAVGHGVGVHAELDPVDSSRAVELRTVAMPGHEVPRAESVTAIDEPELAGLVLDMKRLADAPDADLPGMLAPVVVAYESWLAARDAEAGDPVSGLGEFHAETRSALADCREAARRIRAGIEILAEDADAAEAFRFANHAIWLQRVRGVAAALRRRDPKSSIDDLVTRADVPENRSWRPFQLAFLLLGLPALSDPTHPERIGDDALADLLWFPTGGGKTEAYLGLAAYTFAIRRLKPKLGGYDAGDGVAVVMRYTLRLLTIQQFQRAAALLCACEMIRRGDEQRWGSSPFRLGLWVGGRVTPNTTDAAEEWVRSQKGKRTGQQAAGGSPYQLTTCPWCGTGLQPQRDISVDLVRRRTVIACPDPAGACPFTLRRSPGEGIPVLVVDEELYRLPPALVIATVDKFAQMPWRGEAQALFGRVSGRCERHGYRTPDISWEADSHPAKGNHPPARTLPAGPLRPPDLIIQDELHLIAGPLGSLVGLYETAVDYLCTWRLDEQRVRPKVIASTATVRGAERQVAGLVVRRLAVFPPPALDAADSFFARERSLDASPGRRYLGVCAHGRRFKQVLIRVYVAGLLAAQTLHDKYGANEVTDPYMTLVGYFGSLRELGGMRRLVDDDVRARIGRGGARGLVRRRPPIVEELTSRLSSAQIPQVLDRLALPVGGTRGDGQGHPVDVLLATNMISVGVDITRLGLMVVAGQPKSAAEYIQATSRVGRAAPGLVLTVFNWARPRDLSHYETFEHFHATYNRYVEALSVTPFADRALDRGLTALLVSLIRLADTRWNANRDAEHVDRHLPEIQALAKVITDRAARVTSEQQVAAEVDQRLDHLLDQWAAQAHAPNRRLAYRGTSDALSVPLIQSPDSGAWTDWTCLTSLRNVEPGIRLLLGDGRFDSSEEPPFETAAGAGVVASDGDSDEDGDEGSGG